MDAHLERPVTVARIAAFAGYSAFHFNRVFAARQGASVMAYLRMRRLQHAAARIVAGDRILDVAVRFGFSSQEAFTRAFRRLYGVPPNRFRSLHVGPYTVPPHAARGRDSKGESIMEVRQEQFNDRVLVGYTLRTTPQSAEIPAFWEAVMGDGRWERLMGKMAEDGLNYGLCVMPDGMEGNRLDYMIAFDYDGETPLDADMELYTLGAASYRAFPVPRDGDAPAVPNIRDTWSYIYGQWFPASGVKRDGNKPDFEVYYEDGGVDIFVPVVEA